MSESFPAGVDGASAAADREARIEQLLLSGLDQYFAGQYQQAINIWTRVVFLERGHSRARAYIDRARSAMAERQRECDELVHTGIEAYHAGDVAAARELLTRAVEQGGRSDSAEIFLDRLSRVGAASPVSASPAAAPRTTGDTRMGRAAGAAPAWLPTILTSAIAAAAVLLLTLSLVSSFTDAGPPAAAPERTTAEPLPVVRPSEIAIARARELYAGGHLRDALRALDGVDVADPMRPEADRLRADVQRALLAAVNPSPEPGRRP